MNLIAGSCFGALPSCDACGHGIPPNTAFWVVTGMTYCQECRIKGRSPTDSNATHYSNSSLYLGLQYFFCLQFTLFQRILSVVFLLINMSRDSLAMDVELFILLVFHFGTVLAVKIALICVRLVVTFLHDHQWLALTQAIDASQRVPIPHSATDMPSDITTEGSAFSTLSSFPS